MRHLATLAVIGAVLAVGGCGITTGGGGSSSTSTTSTSTSTEPSEAQQKQLVETRFLARAQRIASGNSKSGVRVQVQDVSVLTIDPDTHTALVSEKFAVHVYQPCCANQPSTTLWHVKYLPNTGFLEQIHEAGGSS